MLKHDDVWRAIDRLAAAYGMSASGLARRSGLDPTTFNKSKRITAEGKLRWPSTESLSKVLAATGASFTEFVELLDADNPQALARRIPLIGFARAGQDGCFDEAGLPTGEAWDEILFPATPARAVYALEVSGSSMEPVYRDGDILIVCPDAPVRRGDRIVLCTRSGEIFVKELIRQSARRFELRSINQAEDDLSLTTEAVAWLSRVIWVSQ
jgi:phage repressor protein C with HTH and peptisase S24 domain